MASPGTPGASRQSVVRGAATRIQSMDLYLNERNGSKEELPVTTGQHTSTSII